LKLQQLLLLLLRFQQQVTSPSVLVALASQVPIPIMLQVQALMLLQLLRVWGTLKGKRCWQLLKLAKALRKQLSRSLN
jgi:hypothetical protein